MHTISKFQRQFGLRAAVSDPSQYSTPPGVTNRIAKFKVPLSLVLTSGPRNRVVSASSLRKFSFEAAGDGVFRFTPHPRSVPVFYGKLTP